MNRILLGAALVVPMTLGGCSDDGGGTGGGDGDSGHDGGSTGDGGGTIDDGFGYCGEAPDEPPSVPRCRTDADCDCGDCVSSTELCSSGCPGRRECDDDPDCGDGRICVFEGGCCGGWVCTDACTDGSCPDDKRCAEDGRCKPVPCEEGYTCPDNTRCETVDGVGTCQRLECTDDADCDCGTCVKERCETAPGQCCPPRPG